MTRGIASNYINIDELHHLNSDHWPIILTLSDTVIQKEIAPRLTNKGTDWTSFKLQLENCTILSDSLKNTEELDEAVENITKDIQQAAWDNTPVIIPRIKGDNYPKEIRQLITEKRKMRGR